MKKRFFAQICTCNYFFLRKYSAVYGYSPGARSRINPESLSLLLSDSVISQSELSSDSIPSSSCNSTYNTIWNNRKVVSLWLLCGGYHSLLMALLVPRWNRSTPFQGVIASGLKLNNMCTSFENWPFCAKTDR